MLKDIRVDHSIKGAKCLCKRRRQHPHANLDPALGGKGGPHWVGLDPYDARATRIAQERCQ